MYKFFFSTLILFTTFFTVIQGMGNMPKNTLSESELKHIGNNLVPPVEINKKIAQEMVKHIRFAPFVSSHENHGARPIGWSLDRNLLVSNYSNSSMIDVATGEKLYTVDAWVQFSPDKSKVFGKGMVWDAASGRLIFQDKDACHYNTRMVFTKDGKKMAYNVPGGIDIVNTKNWKIISIIRESYIRYFLFTPDAKKLLVGWDNCTKFFDIESGQQLPNIYSPPSSQKSVFSPDGKMYATWKYGAVRVFDTEKWQLIKQLPVSNVKATRFQFSPNGQFLFINIWRDITIWNTKTWICVFTQKKCEGRSFIPNSEQMFVELGGSNCVCSNSIGVLSTKTWEIIQTFKDADSPTPLDAVHFALLTMQNREKPFWHYDLQIHHTIDEKTQQWLQKNLLPEQARIIARAHESKQKGKRLVITSKDAIDIFNTIPDYVKKYLIARFRILTELKQQPRRSEGLRNKHKRVGDSGRNAKRRKLNLETKK